MMRPFGYFVHHQGRGHAERCASIAHALPRDRPLTIFCARDDIFPALPPRATITVIPSVFERCPDQSTTMDFLATPSTLHCAPVGWASIRHAMATIVRWFETADPALMICDVSAEVAQLSRICSVPHVVVLQHGDRGDAGHRAAYDGAVGLLAPFHANLAQPEWTECFRKRVCFAAGLGVDCSVLNRKEAREQLGIGLDEEVILIMAGGGGKGFGDAALCVGARTLPTTRWIVIGPVEREWHATQPINLEHRGWVNDATTYIVAADLVISSTGNTTCHQILLAARPWLAVPEWRYFDEQHRKAEALSLAGAACVRPHLPSSADAWRCALDETRRSHRPDVQLTLIDVHPARKAALWLEAWSATLWPT